MLLPATRDLASCKLSIIKLDPVTVIPLPFTFNVFTDESEHLLPNAHLNMTDTLLIWTVAKSFRKITNISLQQTLAITELLKRSLVLITHFII